MIQIERKQLTVGFAIGFGLTLLSGIGSLLVGSIKSEPAAGKQSLLSIEETLVLREQPDYTALLDRVNTLQPQDGYEEKKVYRLKKKLTKDEEEAKRRAKLAAKVDKTLFKNFAVFDDEHQFGLVGIFGEKERFAVLQVVNYATKAARYQKMKVGDSIGPFKLEKLSGLDVNLASDNGAVTLSLFKTQNNKDGTKGV